MSIRLKAESLAELSAESLPLEDFTLFIWSAHQSLAPEIAAEVEEVFQEAAAIARDAAGAGNVNSWEDGLALARQVTAGLGQAARVVALRGLQAGCFVEGLFVKLSLPVVLAALDAGESRPAIGDDALAALSGHRHPLAPALAAFLVATGADREEALAAKFSDVTVSDEGATVMVKIGTKDCQLPQWSIWPFRAYLHWRRLDLEDESAPLWVTTGHEPFNQRSFRAYLAKLTQVTGYPFSDSYSRHRSVTRARSGIEITRLTDGQD